MAHIGRRTERPGELQLQGLLGHLVKGCGNVQVDAHKVRVQGKARFAPGREIQRSGKRRAPAGEAQQGQLQPLGDGRYRGLRFELQGEAIRGRRFGTHGKGPAQGGARRRAAGKARFPGVDQTAFDLLKAQVDLLDVNSRVGDIGAQAQIQVQGRLLIQGEFKGQPAPGLTGKVPGREQAPGQRAQGRVAQQRARRRCIAAEQRGRAEIDTAASRQGAHHQILKRQASAVRLSRAAVGAAVVDPHRGIDPAQRGPGRVVAQRGLAHIEEQLAAGVRLQAFFKAATPDECGPRHISRNDAAIQPGQQGRRQCVRQVLAAVLDRGVGEADQQVQFGPRGPRGERYIQREQPPGPTLWRGQGQQTAGDFQAVAVPGEKQLAEHVPIGQGIAQHAREMHAEIGGVELQPAAARTQIEVAAQPAQRRRVAPGGNGQVVQRGAQLPTPLGTGEIVEAQFDSPKITRGRQLRQRLAQPLGQARAGRENPRQRGETQIAGADAQPLPPPVKLGAVQVQRLTRVLGVKVFR